MAKKMSLQIFTYLHILSPPEYGKVCFLSNDQVVGQILFMFDVQEYVHHRLLPSAYEHSSSKNSASSDGHQNTKWQLCLKQLQLF
jgi:alpha-N-acetylglucosamine transferase